LDATIGDANTFNLAEGLDQGVGADCTQTGQADHPSLGREDAFAFDASTAAIGVAGEARLNVRGAVFTGLTDIPSTNKVLDVDAPIRGLAFSPSGQCLVVGGNVSHLGEGTFVTNLAGSNVERIMTVAVSPRWSVDGAFVGGISVSSGRRSFVLARATCPSQ
jgi:hypothetical protein